MSLDSYLRLLPNLLDRAERLLNSVPEGKPEENTKDKVIAPLLEALGYGPDHRILEADIRSLAGTKTWVDYFLQREGKRLPVMMVEAKPIWEEDIWKANKRQVLDYLRDYRLSIEYDDPVFWIVVTNFREWHVVRLEDREPFWSFTSDDLRNEEFASQVYERFAREGFDRDRLSEFYAERQRSKLGTQFLDDLKTWRLIIANGLRQGNPHLELTAIKAASQVFLNRLLLIRILEAYGQEPFYSLGKLHKGWSTSFRNVPFMEQLIKKFQDTWLTYNTELFASSWVDTLHLPNDYLEPLILPDAIPSQPVAVQLGRGLFGYRSVYNYDFTTLTQDVLGTAYEQFLAHDMHEDSGGIRVTEDPQTRKREGVYYTPHFVVSYIVRETLRPRVAALVDRAVELIERQEFAAARTTVEGIFRVSILDPACGSGSFLLECFDYITDQINKYNAAVEHAIGLLQSEKEGFKRLLEGEIPVGVDHHEERVLVEMLHGVDLDQQAVALAKLSLWTRLLRSQPGHYGPREQLHNHLPALTLTIRNGNSLIDAPLSTTELEQLLQEAADAALKAKSPSLAESERLTAAARLESLVSSVNARVAPSLVRYLASDDELGAAAQRSGFPIDETKTLPALRAALAVDRPTDAWPASAIRSIEAALTTSSQALIEVSAHHPFNWGVEFPDVFDIRRPIAERGFDVVLGNPPYYNVDATFGREAPELYWLWANYSDIYTDKTDILFYFLRRGFALLKPSGDLAYIVSRSFVRADKAVKLRRFLADQTTLVRFVDFLGNKVFKAGIATAIMQFRRTPPAAGSAVAAASVMDLEIVRAAMTEGVALEALPEEVVHTEVLEQAELSEDGWSFGPYRSLFKRIDSAGSPLGGILGIDLGQGMQTGANEAFVLSTGKVAELGIPAEYVKARASTENCFRYGITDNDERVLYLEELTETQLPEPVRAWLELPANKAKLTDRAAYTRGDCEWYRFTWPLHKDLHFGAKIVSPYRASQARFSVDPDGVLIGLTNTTHVFCQQITYSPYAICAVLNSSVLDFRFRALGGLGKLTSPGMFEYFDNQLRKLPIPNFQEHPAEHSELHGLGRELHVLFHQQLQVVRLLTQIAGQQLSEARSLWFYVDPGGPYGDTISLAIDNPDRQGHLLGLAVEAVENGLELWGEVTEEDDWRDGKREWVSLARITVRDVALLRYLLAVVVEQLELNPALQRKQRLTQSPQNVVRAALSVLRVAEFDRDPTKNKVVIFRLQDRVAAELGRADIESIMLRQAAAQHAINGLAFRLYNIESHTETIEEALRVVL